MSIIEKAAERLEQLRKAGVETPLELADPGGQKGAASLPSDHGGTQERHAQLLESTHFADSTQPASTPPVKESTVPPPSAETRRRSKVVEIDLTALAAAGYITSEAKRSQLADEFRVLKRPIITNAQGPSAARVPRANCVMVSSALPGEGKSFVALNLALSIASEVDSTVLLVDADVANPNVMSSLHLPDAHGLLDLLTDPQIELSDVLLRTNVEKLSLLPAGSAHRRATEVLASTAMAELVQQMSTRYPDRILVFDSPPLLATTEARVLASHMGQIVMVVEADVTTHGALLKTLETVENCPIVLMVLNKARRTDVGGYYGYGYGYGYRYGNDS